MNAPTRTPEPNRAQRYLAHVLRLNPFLNAQEVLATRRRALGLKPAVATSRTNVADQSEQRAAVQEFVRKIQARFWTMPQNELRLALDRVDCSAAPELRPTIHRLKIVAAFRNEFNAFTQMKEADPNLVMAFKGAAVFPAAQAGPYRERFLHSIQHRGRLRQAQAAVRVLRRKYPSLYQLEQDWFETILKMKKPKATAETSEVEGLSLSFFLTWPFILLIIFLIRLLFSLL